ncbi:ATP-binding cassette domain-containing protein, partial [Solibacillus isronensis]
MTPSPPVLRVKNLSVSFDATEVVSQVSFTIEPGECLALVGESGSGKSVSARSLIGLAGTGSRVHAETLELAGRDVKDLSQRSWRKLRGKQVGFIL